MITIDALAQGLGLTQTPAQPYAPADVLAGFDPSLIDTYGTLTGDTEISDDDAEAIREAWTA